LPDLETAGTFCFVSDYTRRRAEQIGGWRFSSYAITHPGVSRTEFPPLAHLPDQPWHWRLLWFGRVIEEKGTMTAVSALGLLPEEATLQIVGPVDPSYRHSLERAAGVAGAADRLSFALAARHEVRAYYQQADVTLFTSMIEQEAFGLVPLEAMASGCPVISTCIGGSAEYCSDGVNCVCTPPGDAGALAFAIRQIATRPALRRRLISGGLQTASRLTLDRQAERIEHWLKFAVKTKTANIDR
jgi:glycosyltransferase involved in cell wall biosynthesis